MKFYTVREKGLPVWKVKFKLTKIMKTLSILFSIIFFVLFILTNNTYPMLSCLNFVFACTWILITWFLYNNNTYV